MKPAVPPKSLICMKTNIISIITTSTVEGNTFISLPNHQPDIISSSSPLYGIHKTSIPYIWNSLIPAIVGVHIHNYQYRKYKILIICHVLIKNCVVFFVVDQGMRGYQRGEERGRGGMGGGFCPSLSVLILMKV